MEYQYGAGLLRRVPFLFIVEELDIDPEVLSFAGIKEFHLTVFAGGLSTFDSGIARL